MRALPFAPPIDDLPCTKGKSLNSGAHLNQSPSAGLASLRHATRDIHATFEQQLKVAMPNAGKHDYQVFIEAMWGWLSPFEQALWQSAWPADLQANLRDNKRDWLHQDLSIAGLSEAEISALPLAPCELDLQTPAARFGIAYVLEGAQLGSQVLAKRLNPALAPWPARWLQGYGQDVSVRWRGFLSSLERHVADESSIASASEAALQTFASLQSWFQLRGAA
jgi:heme oxygenase